MLYTVVRVSGCGHRESVQYVYNIAEVECDRCDAIQGTLLGLKASWLTRTYVPHFDGLFSVSRVDRWWLDVCGLRKFGW